MDWFALPNTDHPVIPQNLYRMSGGANNDERFEQIGQSWLKHAFVGIEHWTPAVLAATEWLRPLISVQVALTLTLPA